MSEKIIRMGVRPQFKKPKALFTTWQLPVPLDNYFDRLNRFKLEGEFEYSAAPNVTMTYGVHSVPTALRTREVAIRWHALHAALIDKDEGWIDGFRAAVAYAYWGAHLNCRSQQIYETEYRAGRRSQPIPDMWLQPMMGAAGDCLALGWISQAVCLAREAAWGVETGSIADGDDHHHRRAQYFVLRLIADWDGIELKGLPACASDEPLYNELLANWRSDDLALVENLLLAACDRHTHESTPSNVRKARNADFSDFAMYYNPFEILAVLRLRQVLGLPNPHLDHVGMNSPIGKLHDSAPFVGDDELEAVVAQFRRKYADL